MSKNWKRVTVLKSINLFAFAYFNGSQGNGHYFPLRSQSSESHNPLLANEDMWEESDNGSEEGSLGKFAYILLLTSTETGAGHFIFCISTLHLVVDILLLSRCCFLLMLTTMYFCVFVEGKGKVWVKCQAKALEVRIKG